jgi:acyl carrier protein
MGENANIEASIRKYLVEELGLPDSLTVEDDLVDRGFLASAQLIDLVTFVEDAFGVVLKPVDVQPENLATVATLASVVKKRIAS